MQVSLQQTVTGLTDSQRSGTKNEPVEFGPYENRRDARGGYFTVCGWAFHWFESDAAPQPLWLRTRVEALQAAIDMRDAGEVCA